MHVGLWIHQIPLHINSSWFEKTRKIDAEPKVIQPIEFVGQLENGGGKIDDDETMILLMILEKIKETRLKFC